MSRFEWVNVNGIPWRNTKSSGMEASGAERHACAVCNHNRRTDLQAMEKYEKLWCGGIRS